MTMYDVIISGAGPAGSKCAEIVAKAGYNVALIEKDTSWRKPCGGGVSSRIFKYYPQLRNLEPHKITGISMFSGDFHKLGYTWDKKRDYSVVMDRLVLDNFIRNIAVESGGNLFDNTVSTDFVYEGDDIIGIKTKTQSGIKKFLGKIIIIADGMSSKLAHKSGLREKWSIEELGLAKCAILKGKYSLDPSHINVYFRPYKGYGWIFPLGKNRFNIGCGTFEEANKNHNLNKIYKEFLSDPHINKYFDKEKCETIWKGAYSLPALGVKESSLYGKNIMMIGDAAGFVSPISGEGIHPSIVSGKIAAETAVKALENGEISKNTLKNYARDSHIKKIIRNFKLKRSLVEFFYENEGQNLNTMLRLAEQDQKYRDEVVNMFLFNQVPSRKFLKEIKNR
ncbi:MAG: geranylgeranyl reductase family protein [Promethearchaeota archaeon]